MKIKARFYFEAAHRLPNHPGKCARLHGHGYKVDITVEGPVDPITGMVMDFSDLKQIVNGSAIDLLDHYTLNDKMLFTPTAENVARWIGNNLHLAFRCAYLNKSILPVEVVVWETEDCCAIWEAPNDET